MKGGRRLRVFEVVPVPAKDRQDPMKPEETLLRMFAEQGERMSRMGLPVDAMTRDLEKAVRKYRRASKSGSPREAAQAKREADALMRRYVAEVSRVCEVPLPCV